MVWSSCWSLDVAVGSCTFWLVIMSVSLQEIKQNQILEAKVFHSEYRTGIAVLTGALNFTLTSNIDDVKLRRMPEMPSNVQLCEHFYWSVFYMHWESIYIVYFVCFADPKVLPSCWTILFQDRITLILMAIGNDLYLLDNTACSLVVSKTIFF